jgi:hypothetical protein
MTQSNAGPFEVFKGKSGDEKAKSKHQAEAKSLVSNIGQGIQHDSVKQIERVAYFPEP